MSDKATLLERYQWAREQAESEAPLDYLQLRNRDALRQWRMRRAIGSARPATGSGGHSMEVRP